MTSVHDDSYHIDESELGSESETENKPDEEIDHCRETKYLVFDSSLKKLFSRCLECGVAVIDVSTTTRGSLLTAKMTCSNMHDVVWHSQPLLNRMALGNLLLSAAILFSGNTFQSFSDCFSFLKLQCFQKTTYMTIQDKYLIPVINNAWSAESQRVKQSLRQKEEVRLSGDGRCDSPGYSAKYSLYTFMDQSTEKVVDMSLTQVTEVANSNAMEKAGFIKTLDRIIDDNIPVSTVATDRHVQIGATMKKRYPTISHQYDVWHLSKSIKKKLAEFGKKKKYSSLLPWIQSVSNHLWWSAATCEGNQQSLRERWTSIVHHVVNVHSWSGNQSFHECNHPEIPDTSNIDWLEIGSPAHEALKEVVFDKRLLDAIGRLNQFCHTGSLEVFHSLLTKYTPKRQHFSYKGMVARSQLAALDHNVHCDRNYAIVKTGERQGRLQYKIVFPKSRNSWVAKPVKEKKTYPYVDDLMSSLVEQRKW
ncbi:uncharacterized protein [Ptychodera flava]|uniref:uncharacterized protein n=1 Tax=Ptychodera flava TaxID=63121 RepID=UPI00396A9484